MREVPCFDTPLGSSGEWILWLCDVRAVVEVKNFAARRSDCQLVLTGAVGGFVSTLLVSEAVVGVVWYVGMLVGGYLKGVLEHKFFGVESVVSFSY